ISRKMLPIQNGWRSLERTTGSLLHETNAFAIVSRRSRRFAARKSVHSCLRRKVIFEQRRLPRISLKRYQKFGDSLKRKSRLSWQRFHVAAMLTCCSSDPAHRHFALQLPFPESGRVGIISGSICWRLIRLCRWTQLQNPSAHQTHARPRPVRLETRWRNHGDETQKKRETLYFCSRVHERMNLLGLPAAPGKERR